MKTILKILALSLPILMIACSKDSNGCDPTDENSSCYSGPDTIGKLLLVEIKKNGSPELRFEYDDRNRVIVRHVYTTDGSFLENFIYDDGDRLTVVERKKDGEIYLREEFSYGEGDRPTTGVWTSPGTENVLLQYDYSGNMVTETSYNGEGEVIMANTYTFDDKGNLIQTIIGSVVMEYGDFDDKQYSLTNYPWAWKLSSVNNPRSIKVTSSMGSYDHSWKYTYNTSGYPIKAEVYDSQSNAVLETSTYDYISAK